MAEKQGVICSRCNPEGELGLCEKCALELKEEKFYEGITTGQGVLAQVLVQHICNKCSKVIRVDHYAIFDHIGRIYDVDCVSTHNLVKLLAQSLAGLKM
ncbi:unnamed protein product [Rotaria sordida]|uniref:Uncharacterized protein n=1 Tax=Rotaria sordida TaxID=392033 RepID=A0A815PFF1_9BILA|nr:unnamed protein product [Rotaria sordida]CAF1638076.1 unnamed protein product [Rotaria sordida]